MKNKGFTLIELLAVIVILAIIALIATPIVMNLITKSQEGADARSVEAYGKALESAYYQARLTNPSVEPNPDTLTVEISGDTVSCTKKSITGTEVVLSGCTVGTRTTKEYAYSSKTGASGPTNKAS